MLGEQAAGELAEAQNRPPELCVRVNTLKAEEVDLGVPVRLDPEVPEARVLEAQFDVGASRELAEGLIWPQSRASMLPARLLAPEPGMRVLDLCAAPGGKSGQLAALMENRGELVCVERHPGRAKALRGTLELFGASCARVEVADALEFADGGFDRILLDPPCSGLGVLAGRPDARWRRTLEGAEELADLQRRMLDHARGLLAARRAACLLGLHRPPRRVRGRRPRRPPDPPARRRHRRLLHRRRHSGSDPALTPLDDQFTRNLAPNRADPARPRVRHSPLRHAPQRNPVNTPPLPR